MLALVLFGCRSAEERRFEAEVATLDRAIDAVRAAPNEGKQALLDVLERTPCEDPEVCRVRSICLDAYRAHVAAVAAKDRARDLLGSPGGGVESRQRAAEELSLADRELGRAKAGATRCASEQGNLRRRARQR